MRQAFAGMIWSKQYYELRRAALARSAIRHSRRLRPQRRTRPQQRLAHVFAADVLSMPDTWEFPWFAAWDLAFHCVVLALVDPQFAKDQLILMLREWYMHPNGQIPAYEWAFGDVNPPVHAWAALRVFQIEQAEDRQGRPGLPRARLPQAPPQLRLVGQPQGRARQQHLPGRLPRPRQHRPLRPQHEDAAGMGARPGRRHELDGDVLPEPARHGPRARRARIRPTRTWPASSGSTSSTSRTRCTHMGEDGFNLWDEEDGFFYDAIRRPDGSHDADPGPLAVGLHSPDRRSSPATRSCSTGSPASSGACSGSSANRPDLHRLLRLDDAARRERAGPLLARHAGAAPPRAAVHARRERVSVALRHPVGFPLPPRPPLRDRHAGAVEHRIDYEPGESTTGTVRRQLELARADLVPDQLPRSSSRCAGTTSTSATTSRSSARRARASMMTLLEVFQELARRLSTIFLPGKGRRPAGLRRHRDLPRRPPLEGPRPLPRVLPRRHGRRASAHPPDRLDGPRRQAPRRARRRDLHVQRQRAVGVGSPVLSDFRRASARVTPYLKSEKTRPDPLSTRYPGFGKLFPVSGPYHFLLLRS